MTVFFFFFKKYFSLNSLFRLRTFHLLREIDLPGRESFAAPPPISPTSFFFYHPFFRSKLYPFSVPASEPFSFFLLRVLTRLSLPLRPCSEEIGGSSLWELDRDVLLFPRPLSCRLNSFFPPPPYRRERKLLGRTSPTPALLSDFLALSLEVPERHSSDLVLFFPRENSFIRCDAPSPL